MFSKLAAFRRSKSNSAQKGNRNHCDSLNSELLHATEEGTSESTTSSVSPKSFLVDETASENSYDNSLFPFLDVSPVAARVSDAISCPSSIETYTTCVGKESLTASSVFEEIDVGPPVLLPYDDAEEEFLEDHESYFLHLSVNNARKDQYPKLELQRIVYLDYATCPLYSRFQVEQHMQFLLEETESFVGSKSTFGNRSAQQNTYVDSTCRHILNHLNTTPEEYSIIFTPGLSSCYRLFGEIYPLPKGSVLLASHDHHKSVLHMLHAAARCGAKIGGLPLGNKDLCFHGRDLHRLLRKRGWSGHGHGILVYSAQSFLTGICHSLCWIVGAQQNGWEVLLDVSSCLPMVRIDLSLYQPEFVIGSLHHILGYPSDVGFMLVRRSSHSVCLNKGPTQLRLARLPDNGKAIHVSTESESLNVRTFAALHFGLEHLESVGVDAFQKRGESLIGWLLKTLRSLKHKFGEKPLLQVYGSLDPKYRGSILAFNVLDSTGCVFPAKLVQQLAVRSDIFLDVGNLGDLDLANILYPQTEKRGVSLYASTCNLLVIRLSLGPVSTFDDAYRLAQYLSRFRDEDYMSSEAAGYIKELENEC